MKVSSYLKTSTQNNVFYDIEVNTDNKAFLNPLLVNQQSNNYANMTPAVQKINSFFNYIVGSLTFQQLQEVALVSEENATHLGYSTDKSLGHGPKHDSLLTMLTNLNHNVQYSAISKMKNNARKLSALTMFVPDFSYDSVSDLTTRIVEKELYLFTVDTVKKLGYSKYLSQKTTLTYWNPQKNSWNSETVNNGLSIEGKFTLLIPKLMVEEGRFEHNPDNYIRHIIAPRIIKTLPDTGKKHLKKDVIRKATKNAGGSKKLVREDLKSYPDDFLDYFK